MSSTYALNLTARSAVVARPSDAVSCVAWNVQPGIEGHDRFATTMKRPPRRLDRSPT
jgi:hypothetical protein